MDDDRAPIGVRLREARMRQGLDLADCAAATRIRERYLIAIEDGRFEALPDPAYVNGFVRAYAAHLGVSVSGPERELPVPRAPLRSPQVRVTATRATSRGLGGALRWRAMAAIVVLAVLVVLVATAVGAISLPFG